ncbi:serine/threonine-protein kinase pim-2-like [Misgurnus anguillicaudatus]|uniref:serine/threonine-protein kinase pim-2-like n=1 Tax=Misgurnus anguillicaudatus TaxID=75329 RepID=UPI003CCF7C6B
MMLELQRHPPLCSRVIRMHEWFEFPDGYIVVYEMLSHPWMRLDKFLEKQNDLISERMIRDLFRQLVLATKYCWEHRVYRLFSFLENIMVNTKTMKLKLCGFGGGRLAPVSSCEPHLIDPEPDSRPEKLLTPLMGLRDLLNFMVIYSETFADGELVVSDECRELCHHLAVYRFHDAFDGILRHPWMAQDEWSYTGRPVTRFSL